MGQNQHSLMEDFQIILYSQSVFKVSMTTHVLHMAKGLILPLKIYRLIPIEVKISEEK